MKKLLLGVLIGVVLAPIVLAAWLCFGRVPVAVADPPFPQEEFITGIPLHQRIDRELAKSPIAQPDEESLVAGAHIYNDKCAVCHGFHGKPSQFGAHMYPLAPQLWEKHGGSAVIGVSDDPPGETYWKVANGIRLTGMPAFKDVLSDTEIWRVSLLLANADKPLPPTAVEILRGSAQFPELPVTQPQTH
jgi:mono/diheme cytochrome c family protein